VEVTFLAGNCRFIAFSP